MQRAAAYCLAGFLLVSSGNISLADDAKAKLGTLTCSGHGKIGLVLGSKEKLSCKYQPHKGSSQQYQGTITRIGLDVGVKGKSVMVWTVFSSTSQPGSRFLIGNYIGAAADASIGVGGGGNLLVGGAKNTVTLQPLSVQAQTGVNLAVGVAGLSLR